MKTMKIHSFLLLFFCLSACDFVGYVQEEVITETRSLKDFSIIHHQTIGTVEVKQSAVFAVKIEGGKSIVPKLKTVVQNGTLNIYFDEKVGTLNKLKIFVEMPTINALKLSGLGAISTSDLESSTLKLELNGSGKIGISKLKAQSVEALLNGTGRIEIEGGTSAFVSARVSGLGTFAAQNHETQVAKTEISGAGFIKVFATSKLEVVISGDGLIEYKGSPTITQNITGNGSIRRL